MPGHRPDTTPEVDARLIRTLYELSTSAKRALDPGELIKVVAEHACQLLHGDAVALFLWDDSAGVLKPVYSNDPHEHTVGTQPIRLGQGAAGQAFQHRLAVAVEDYAHYEHAVAWGIARGLRSVQAVPLMVGDRPIGALVVRFYAPQRIPGALEERTLVLLAAQVAPALEAARLYAASSLERQHERALREITQALAANLDERQVVDLAVSFSAELLRAPYARVWVFEPSGELRCAAAEGFVHADTFKRRLAGDSTSGHVARQQVVNLANAPAGASWRFNREFGERTGLGAYLGAGLWRAGESLGVLEVMRQTGDGFSEMEEQLLVSLSNAVAVAVSNAREHAAVERLAREAEQRAVAAAESELVLRSVYEAIGSGVLVFDPHGMVTNANAAAAEILGRPVDELMGMHSSDFLPAMHEDGSPLLPEERPNQQALHGRKPMRKSVFGSLRPDGALRWLQADSVPILAPDGDVLRVISSFIDITDAKRSAEALAQRDAILQAVAFAAEQLLTSTEWEESLDDVLARLGAATGVSRVHIVPGHEDDRDVGRASYHVWTAEHVAAPQLANGAPSPDLEEFGLGRWVSILRGGGIVQGRLRDFPPDEHDFLEAQHVFSLVLVPIFVGPTWWGFIGFDDCREEREWPAGTIEVLKTAAGTLGAAILRRQAEAERLQLVREQAARAEAEEAQRRMRFLAEASQVLAASLDYERTLQDVADLAVPALADCCFIDIREPDGPIRRVASSVAAAVAHQVGESAGVHIDPMGDHPVAVVVRTGQPRLVTPLSSDDWQPGNGEFESRLTMPLPTRSGATGAITWLTAGGRPVLGRQDLGLAQALARRCALAIDNSRLYREARAAVSIRDEFLSVAAHELKTPMTSLRGYAQLLAREFEKDGGANVERARRAARTIQVQSDKLARLVSQLLDVSRIQSGKLILERHSTDLGQLVGEVVEVARMQLKDHVLVSTLPDKLIVDIDPLRVEQVVTNLIDNAIKYSPEGGQIDVSVEAPDARTVRLSVRDHGVGVPAHHRAQIFDRFYQAHAGGPLTSMAGMGLGLYISRQIVEMHDGTIEAEFPEDGGTRFVVTLPR
jgi:PAS domain S-box-containing protein